MTLKVKASEQFFHIIVLFNLLLKVLITLNELLAFD